MKLALGLLVLGSILLGAPSCHQPPPEAPAVVAAAPMAACYAPARHLPADTVAFAVLPDPLRLADALGRQRFIARYREAYERAFIAVVDELDHDLLSPGGLEAVGLDPHRPAGAAWLTAGQEAMVAFATLKDSSRFKAALVRAARARQGGVEVEVVGDALVLEMRGEGDIAFVLFDGLVMAVVGDGDTEPFYLARRLAELGPAQSLFEQDDFQGAVGGLGSAADLVIYLDSGPSLRWAAGLDPRWAGTDTAAASRALELAWRRQLGKARGAGASADEILAIDEQYRSARQSLRRDPEAERERAIIGSLGPAAVALEVLPNGIRARGRLALEAGSVLGGLLRNRSDVPRLVRRLAERPELLVHARVDVDAAIELGRSLLRHPDVLDEMLQVDVGQELAAILDGDVAVALDAPLQRVDEAGGLGEPQLQALVGLRDDGRARKLLGALARTPDLREVLRPTSDDGYRLELDGLAPLWLGVRPGMLVVTKAGGPSSAPLSKRGTAGGWSGTGHRLLTRLAASKDAAFGAGGAVGLWLALSSEGGDLSYQTSMSSPKAATGDAPPSPAAKALAASIADLDQRIARLSDDMARRAADKRLAFARRLGVIALRAERTDRGLDLSAGWVVGDESLTAVLEELPSAWLSPERGDPGARRRWEVLQQLMDRREGLREQLSQSGDHSSSDDAPAMPAANDVPATEEDAVQAAP